MHLQICYLEHYIFCRKITTTMKKTKNSLEINWYNWPYRSVFVKIVQEEKLELVFSTTTFQHF